MKIEDYPKCSENPFKELEFNDRSLKSVMVLRGQSLKLLHYMAYTSRKNKLRYTNKDDDFELYFDVDDAKVNLDCSKSAVYLALSDLLKNGIIARTSKPYIFYINPEFLLHGDNRKLRR